MAWLGDVELLLGLGVFDRKLLRRCGPAIQPGKTGNLEKESLFASRMGGFFDLASRIRACVGFKAPRPSLPPK